MNNDLINILSNSNKDIDNQKLMDYLAGKLSAEEKHEIEKLMADNDFVNDALEGLGEVNNKKIQDIVDQMNMSLQKKLKQKKIRKEKRRLKEYPWIYLAIAVILVLIVLAYYIIHRLESGQ